MRYLMVVMSALVFACSSPQSKDTVQVTERNDLNQETKLVDTTKMNDFEQSNISVEEKFLQSLSPAEKIELEKEIAQFAVCALYHKDPSEVSVKKQDHIYLGGYSDNEGKTLATKIKIGNKNIEWGNSDGRWRNHPLDESLTYSIANGIVNIKVRYSDGSVSSEEFTSKLIRF